MEITGRVLQVLPIVEGENEKGAWVKARCVVEYGDDYPKKAMLTTRSRTIADAMKKLALGRMYRFVFTIDAWEYEGNWYNEVRLLKIWEVESRK